MKFARRIGAVLASCLLLVATATPLGAQEREPATELELVKGIATPYVVRGDAATFWYTARIVPGSGPEDPPVPITVSNVQVFDAACTPTYVSGDANHIGVLEMGEVWHYECTYTPAGDGYDAAYMTADDINGRTVRSPDTTFALYPATIRKLVVLYWNYVDAVRYGPGADVPFALDLFFKGDKVGTERFSMNTPLHLWVVAGPWGYQEASPLPDGYHVARGEGRFDAGPDLPRHDNTLFNYITYDLSVDKTGPMLAHRGDEVTYEYYVRNGGPAAVRPALADDECAPIEYVKGDANDNGLVDPDETWLFHCTMTPTWVFNEPFTNTVEVWDAEFPAWEPRFGGDTDLRNNVDTYTLYPFVLRKAMFLYWDGAGTLPYDGLEDVEFTISATNGAVTPPFTISENAPAFLWLAGGVWQFHEVRIPDGYETGYPGGITYVAGRDYPDWTFPNVALFDLAVEKSGPEWSMKGDKVTYEYHVTNSGPAAVTPMIADDKCDPAYVSGDTDTDGKVDPGETWIYRCTIVPDWVFNEPFTNTVKVWDREGVGLEGWYLGGDTNPDNNVDTYTLYPFVLRKGVYLYWGEKPAQVPADGFDMTAFKVAFSHDGSYVDAVMISEAHPAKLFLSEGTWVFTEKHLPDGIYPVYGDGITYVTGKDYPDWTHINIAEFDLKVEKKLWWGKVVPGQTIAYKYKVRNGGPAAVTPMIEDDKCAPLIYRWGDADKDGMVDPGETWVFKCLYEVTEKVGTELTNTVEVWDAEGVGIDPHYGGDVELRNNVATLTLDVGWYACATWCWRHHKHLADWPDGYTPDTPLGVTFGLWHKLDLNRDGSPDTLEDALHYAGGGGLQGHKRKLLKSAVTALLNEAEYGELYPAYESEADLIEDVKKAYKSGKRWKMKKLMKQLDFWNFGGVCAL